MYPTGSAMTEEIALAELIRQFFVEITFGPLEAFFSELGSFLVLILNPLSLFA